MHKPIDISNYFLKKHGQETNITPMKLVKLVYISHGWYLGITGNALLDENPEAWKYGPVIPTIYHYFKSFGRDPIKLSHFPNDPDVIIDDGIREFLDAVWSVYGRFTAVELSAKTHEVGTPWHITWNEILASKNGRFAMISSQIPDSLIKNYYQERLMKNKALETA